MFSTDRPRKSHLKRKKRPWADSKSLWQMLCLINMGVMQYQSPETTASSEAVEIFIDRSCAFVCLLSSGQFLSEPGVATL